MSSQLVLNELLTPQSIDPILADLVADHGEDGCWRYLEAVRWPNGVECPRCESRRLLWLETRAKHQCNDCRYQFRVTAGTLFHSSHLPLWKWFIAISLMLSNERGLPASELNEILGGSYKSAWFLEHRVRAAMAITAEAIAPSAACAAAQHPAVTTEPGRGATGNSRPNLPLVQPPASWPQLERLVAGRYQRLGAKHLAAYWNELRWRDTNHTNPDAFRETVAALLAHPPVPYAILTAPPTHLQTPIEAPLSLATLASHGASRCSTPNQTTRPQHTLSSAAMRSRAA
jgi:transposase-like protein